MSTRIAIYVCHKDDRDFKETFYSL